MHSFLTFKFFISFIHSFINLFSHSLSLDLCACPSIYVYLSAILSHPLILSLKCKHIHSLHTLSLTHSLFLFLTITPYLSLSLLSLLLSFSLSLLLTNFLTYSLTHSLFYSHTIKIKTIFRNTRNPSYTAATSCDGSVCIFINECILAVTSHTEHPQ